MQFTRWAHCQRQVAFFIQLVEFLAKTVDLSNVECTRVL